MNGNIKGDLAQMEERLKVYVDKGRVTGSFEVREEPVVATRVDASMIKPLKRASGFCGNFVAVDCSTRTLKRANNWGIYLMRVSHASVEGRDVDWSFEERICTVVGDSYGRSNYLKDVRIELESQKALSILQEKSWLLDSDHRDGRSSYLLLDGGGYFGGERKFRVSLYDRCEKAQIILLAISKNSPSLHDDKGRDFLATALALAPYDLWVYHPVRKADKDRSLYGDIAVAKLCSESQLVFRCDIMEYLASKEVSGLLSPLISISEDPRCIGYPVTLWLAHDFSTPSDSMLLSYHDQVEEVLNNVGLLDVLRREEQCCSFADQIHGIKHAFEWEWWSDQF